MKGGRRRGRRKGERKKEGREGGGDRVFLCFLLSFFFLVSFHTLCHRHVEEGKPTTSPKLLMFSANAPRKKKEGRRETSENILLAGFCVAE